jgi:hypothetical protein
MADDGAMGIAQKALKKASSDAYDAVVRAIVNKHARRTGGFSIVSRLNANFGAGQGSAVVGTFGVTVRIAHQNKTRKELYSVAPVFAHYAPGAGTESNTPQDYSIKSAMELFGTVSDQTTNAPQRVYANGSEIYTLSRRGVLVASEVQVSLLNLGTVFERTGITTLNANGNYGRSQIARGSTGSWGANTGEGAGVADNVLTGTVSNNVSSAYSASLILGRTVDGTIAFSISIIGDSKAVATDDEGFGPNAGGWAYRSCIDWPGGNHAIAGEKLRDTLTPTGFLSRLELTKYATHILDEYLTNDVGAGDSVAVMKANTLASALRFMRRGQNYIKATVPPLTDSTNGWFDVAGQTVRAYESNRQLINSWLRDSSVNGFVAQAKAQVASIPDAGWADFVDPCLGIEVNAANALTLNGGFYQGAQSAAIVTGAVASATATSVTDTAATLTVNGLKGYVIHITAGTGSGQVRSIAYNTATVISTGNPWVTTPDATSTYRVFDGNTIDGTHESTGGHTREAAAVKAKIDQLMLIG